MDSYNNKKYICRYPEFTAQISRDVLNEKAQLTSTVHVQSMIIDLEP